jgi:nucleotide-binding universal stress UspA family protein
VLACVDGSESSMKAADYAVMLAKQNDAQLIALNVIVSQLGYTYSTGAFGLVTSNTINDILEKSKQEAQKWFNDIRTQ